MTDKEIAQNNLIELIEDWVKRGKPLGLSNARQIIDEYENLVKNLTIPRVSGTTDLKNEFLI